MILQVGFHLNFPWIGSVAAVVVLVLLFTTNRLRNHLNQARWRDFSWLFLACSRDLPDSQRRGISGGPVWTKPCVSPFHVRDAGPTALSLLPYTRAVLPGGQLAAVLGGRSSGGYGHADIPALSRENQGSVVPRLSNVPDPVYRAWSLAGPSCLLHSLAFSS